MFVFDALVTQDGKLFACGEATNGRLGLGISTGNVQIPRHLTSLGQYVVKKVAVHSGKNLFVPCQWVSALQLTFHVCIELPAEILFFRCI